MLTERQRDQRWLEEQRWVNLVRSTVGDKVRQFLRAEGGVLYQDVFRGGVCVTRIDEAGNLYRVDPATLGMPLP